MVDAYQAIGVGEGQRLEQHTVDDAENHRVGGDAERQGGDRDHGEAGVAHEVAKDLAEVHEVSNPDSGSAG